MNLNRKRCFFLLLALYCVILSYEILGSVLYYERCEGGIGFGEVFKFFAFAITFNFFLAPLYVLVVLNGFIHYQESLTRFGDMCQRHAILGYQCTEITQTILKQNTSTHVHYGTTLYDRGFECTKYITLNSLFLLQCLMLFVLCRSFHRKKDTP